MRSSSRKLLADWRERVGRSYENLHTGRVGRLAAVEWRFRTQTGGDWGVYLTLDYGDETRVARPAFVREVTP